jgi:hypothetical protein
MTEPRKITSLDIKLPGPSAYSERVVSIETYLDFIPVYRTDEFRVWDIVMGIYIQPAPAASKSTVEEAQIAGKAIRAWKDANSIAPLTI